MCVLKDAELEDGGSGSMICQLSIAVAASQPALTVYIRQFAICYICICTTYAYAYLKSSDI